jgi:hypothetical protein
MAVQTLPLTQEVKNEMGIPERITNNPISSVGIITILKGAQIVGGWETKMDLFVELKQEASNFIAVNHEVEEYGIGQVKSAAIEDLLNSLVDYCISLGKREGKLAEREQGDLANLRRIFGK